jgi:hypothetical protein
MFHPKPLFVVSRLVKSKERFPFVQSLVVSLNFLSISNKYSENKTIESSDFSYLGVFLIHSIFALYNGTVEQASPYIMLRHSCKYCAANIGT